MKKSQLKMGESAKNKIFSILIHNNQDPITNLLKANKVVQTTTASHPLHLFGKSLQSKQSLLKKKSNRSRMHYS